MGFENIKYSDVVLTVSRLRKEKTDLSIALIGNMNLASQFQNVLKYILYQELELNCEITCFGDSDIMDLQNQIRRRYDYIILHYCFFEFLGGDIPGETNWSEEVCSRYKLILSKLNDESEEVIILSIPEPYLPGKKLNAYEEYRAGILEMAAALKRGCTIDLAESLLQTGRDDYYSFRDYYAYDVAYSLKGCLSVSHLISSVIRKEMGRIKKCLVLDCDNVLWGGILEEESINGIKLDKFYPGNQYYYFQTAVKKLWEQGIILAVCSKNKESDVLEVIRSHPFMVLREEYFAAWQINWRNKAENIKAIAKELNIGLESILFLDDSEFEIHQVAETLPLVTAVLFDDNFKTNAWKLLFTTGWFNLEGLTKEDRERNVSYQNEIARKREMQAFGNYEDFLASLNMKLEREAVNDMNLSRIVQLSVRTNRGNLSGSKYTEKEVRENLQEKGHSWLCYRLTDRLGSYGYIAALHLIQNRNQVVIKDFYLSCRAMGKKIEEMILDDIAELYQGSFGDILYCYKDNGRNGEFKEVFDSCLSRKGKVVQ